MIIMDNIKEQVINIDNLTKAYISCTKGLLHKDTVIWAKHNILERVYYLYNSISVGLLCKLWNLVLDGGMVELPLGKIARIIKYQLKGIDESKF